jgi:putative Mg2+ transporter-C (MgtC) family protein
MEFPSQAELFLRILLAAVLGGVIGMERELSDHPAGLRTHIALALGAALFGALSAYGFREFDASRAVTNYQVDPTRVASTMVTGIGFLGGGAILKEGAKVRGLTTAASLWVTAAIGLACALGEYGLAAATTGVVVLSLTVLRRPQRWRLFRMLSRANETVVIHVAPGRDAGGVVAALNAIPGLRVQSLLVRDRGDECVVQADVAGSPGQLDLESLLTPLADRDDVASLEVT